MLSFFPRPYQDEVLFGIVARYHQQSGNSLYRQTVEELFGDRNAHSSVTLPTRLGTMAERSAPFGISFDGLLYNHTLYPYDMVFSSEKTTKWVYDWAIGSKPGPADYQLGVFGMQINKPQHLCFCPECYSEELKQYGEGFWHRMHQTAGVLVCERHHCRLLETTVPYFTKGSNQYISAAPSVLFPAFYPSPLSPLARQQAIQVAGDIQYLYQNYGRLRAAFARQNFSFQNLFLQMLRKKGMASDGGSLRLKKYCEAFCAFFASDLLNALGLSFGECIGRPWVISICRSNQRDFHPLRYILLAEFLCGGLQGLVERAEAYAPEELMITLTPRKQVVNYEEKREDYRLRWQKVCEALPGAGQNEIRKTAEAVYTWLNRHDRGWLSQHPSKRKQRGGNRTYADWTEKDYRFSSLVTKAAEKIRLLPGKPVQITKTKLRTEIGCRSIPSKQRSRLPLTEKFIAQEVEDQLTFRMRKVQWAVRELTALDVPVVKWRVMKLAGIRDEAWNLCWEAYMAGKNHFKAI